MARKLIDKVFLADMKDLRRAKRPEDLKRFKVPDWYLDPKQMKSVRKKLMVSQSRLAKDIHVSVKTVQHWEQKSGASGPGAILLRLLSKHPGLYGELRQDAIKA